jgi:hypothetical protein
VDPRGCRVRRLSDERRVFAGGVPSVRADPDAYVLELQVPLTADPKAMSRMVTGMEPLSVALAEVAISEEGVRPC